MSFKLQMTPEKTLEISFSGLLHFLSVSLYRGLFPFWRMQTHTQEHKAINYITTWKKYIYQGLGEQKSL